MIIVEYTYLSVQKKRFETDENTVLIGRQAGVWSVDLDLTPDVTTSRRHAMITYHDHAYWLEDLGSQAGTTLNGTPVSRPTLLSTGDVIGIGKSRLRLEIISE